MILQVSTLLPQPYPSTSTKAGEGSAIPLAVLLGLAVAGFGSSHPYERGPHPPWGKHLGMVHTRSGMIELYISRFLMQ